VTDSRRHIEEWYARLPGFLREAEGNGFIRDPRQWPVLVHVLDDAGDDVTALKYRLAPILVHSPEQQEAFYRLYDLWFSGIEQQEVQVAATDAIPDRKETVPVPEPIPFAPDMPEANSNQNTGPQWWQWALLFAPFAGLLVIAMWYFGALHPLTLLVAVISVGLAFWSIWRWKHRKIEIARQGPNDSGDNFWDFRLPHRRIGFGPEFRRIAARLRERVPGSAYRINVPKTVQQTARSGGFFSIRLQPRREIPSCLMLIDLSNDNNHRAALFDAFYHYLKDWEVPVERYFYRGIPRMLWNEDRPHGIALDTLAANYGHSRLLLLGDAWNLLDARTMRPTALTNVFEAWKDRILLTPIPFPQWTARERNLESLFLIAPFTPEGLQVIDRHLNPEEPFDWELQRPDTWPEEAIRFEETELPQSLRPYFPDPAIMEWLAALAFYPSLNWNLTLFLGDLLSNRYNRPLLTFENLRQLSRLHWFYNGFIPEEAREALYGLLDKETSQYIHENISVLLQAQLNHREDYVSEERNKVYLQILLHKAHAGKASREELRELRRLAKNERQDFLIARYTNKPKPWDWVLDSGFSFLIPDRRKWEGLLPIPRKEEESESTATPGTGIGDISLSEPLSGGDKPVRIFISYLREDLAFFEELRSWLTPLEKTGSVELFSDEKTEGWWSEIEEKRRQSDILLVFVSAASTSRKDFFEKDLFFLKAQIGSGRPRLVPVLVTPCNWQDTILADYQMIPRGLRPINQWEDSDAAWTEVIRELQALIVEIQQSPTSPSQEPSPLETEPSTPSIPQPDMVFVSGGAFTMGWVKERDGEGGDDEKPAHEVTVKDFYIGRTAVTVEQYMAFVHDTKSHYPEWLEEGSQYHIQTGTNDHYKKLGAALQEQNHPIVGISWHDAVAYCEWLSNKTGKRYRLPTEAEWEYASRGGQESKRNSTTHWTSPKRWEYAPRGGQESKGYLYSGSNDIDEVAWYDKNSGGNTHPVGTKKPNELGLYDMSGNVWEWCEDDWHNNYERAPTDGSAWVDSPRASNRVARGGSWRFGAGYCRAAIRLNNTPTHRYSDVGFRLAL
jgi:formylglycine-generating enzyme required for sulfatase activity